MSGLSALSHILRAVWGCQTIVESKSHVREMQAVAAANTVTLSQWQL